MWALVLPNIKNCNKAIIIGPRIDKLTKGTEQRAQNQLYTYMKTYNRCSTSDLWVKEYISINNTGTFEYSYRKNWNFIAISHSKKSI